METNDRSKVAAFDTLFSSNHIQMLKVMLPYMDNQTQKSLAVYIKFLELKYTIEYYQKNPYPLCGCMEKESEPDIQKLCTELLPYCTESERKRLEQIRSMLQGMEMYKEMSKTMELMKDFMPDNAFSGNEAQADNSGFDMMSMLMNMLSSEQIPSPEQMLTPEQKQLFDLFGGKKDAE